MLRPFPSLKAVSYTHLDVYKRQALLWLFCLYASVRGIYLSYLTRRTDFFWITAFFIALTILTVRKVVRYLRTPYHCIPLLNRRLSKQHLQELLENEVFELVKFQDRLLKKYVTAVSYTHLDVYKRQSMHRRAIML